MHNYVYGVSIIVCIVCVYNCVYGVCIILCTVCVYCVHGVWSFKRLFTGAVNEERRDGMVGSTGPR